MLLNSVVMTKFSVVRLGGSPGDDGQLVRKGSTYLGCASPWSGGGLNYAENAAVHYPTSDS